MVLIVWGYHLSSSLSQFSALQTGIPLTRSLAYIRVYHPLHIKRNFHSWVFSIFFYRFISFRSFTSPSSPSSSNICACAWPISGSSELILAVSYLWHASPCFKCLSKEDPICCYPVHCFLFMKWLNVLYLESHSQIQRLSRMVFFFSTFGIAKINSQNLHLATSSPWDTLGVILTQDALQFYYSRL